MSNLILIIDDDSAIVGILKFILKTFNIETVEAFGGRDGMDQIEKNLSNFDIIFVDMVMDEIDGLKIYSHVRKKDKNKKIVLMSGYPLAELFDDPNVFYLNKPFSIEDIKSIVENSFPDVETN